METIPSSRTITLAGEFDFCNKDVLASTLAPAETVDVAVIEMGLVRFMDSSAIGCLIRLKKRMVEGGKAGTVRLIGANPQIARVFTICGLDKIFEMEPAV